MTIVDPGKPIPVQPPAARDAEVRISTVLGDRLCIRCGFNLVGQPVVREPVYGMLMVRCPECSTPASLQEYPLLGRWATRWAAALAGLWLLVILALLFMTAGILLGEAMGVSHAASARLNTVLEHAQRSWYRDLDDTGRAAVTSWIKANLDQGTAQGWLDETWWSTVDRRALLQGAGGWWRATQWKALANWPWVLLTGAMFGAVWSVVLLGVRRRRLLLLALIPPILAVVLYYVFANEPNVWMQGVIPTFEASWSLVGLRIFVLTLAITPLGLWAGVLLGRPLVRLLARTLLPPRMTGSLAFLWLADGKDPPRPTGTRPRTAAGST